MGFVALPDETYRALVGRGGVPSRTGDMQHQTIAERVERIRFEGTVQQEQPARIVVPEQIQQQMVRAVLPERVQQVAVDAARLRGAMLASLRGNIAPPDSSVHDSPDARARALLMSLLDKSQRRSFENHHWFEVLIPKNRMTAPNVVHTKTLRMGHCRACHQTHCASWCVHPTWWYAHGMQPPPRDDDLITMLMWVQGNPDQFFTTANYYPAGHGCLH